MKILSPAEYTQQYGQDNYLDLVKTSPITQQQAPNLFQRFQNTINQAGDQTYNALAGKGDFAGQSTIRRATGAVSSLFSPFTQLPMDALPPAASNAIQSGTSNLLNWVANNAGKNPFSFGSSPNTGLTDTTQFQRFANSPAGKTTEDIAGTAANLGNIAGNILAVDQAATGLQKGLDVTKAGVDKTVSGAKSLYQDVTGNVPEGTPLNESKILDQYNRAIRPTVKGKSTSTQLGKANADTLEALKAITRNKEDLFLTDAHGEHIRGELPKSVDQLSQAITQTKEAIFKNYDAVAKYAGDQGVTVDASSISSELDPLIKNKALRVANPRAIQWAQEWQSRLADAGSLNVSDAQEIIQHLNDGLKSFYQNPSYDTASTAYIDSMVANKFRELLDQQIETATGAQYQTLKNTYGALKSIEKDVAHRNVVWGRQNAVGLAANLSNVASGAELVRGLIKLNPADLAASATIKGFQKYMQYLNNPDVGVSRIFSALEKASPSSITPGLSSVKPPPIRKSLKSK